MARVARNDPCPCGSGKKYKKCCLEVDAKRLPTEGTRSGSAVLPVRTVVTDLDELSNSVQDLIRVGDLDRAEAACRELQERYPDQVDGIWRLAAVHEARGNRQAAARYYREAAEFMRGHEGFDEQSIVHMIHSAEEMEAEPGAPPNGGPAAPLGNSGVTEGPPSVS